MSEVDDGQLRLFPQVLSEMSTPVIESTDTLAERARWVAEIKENIDDVRVGRQTSERSDSYSGVVLFAAMENLLADILEEMTGERYP